MALYAAAVGNFLTIAAGLQVPWRLGWKEDLQQLHPFTQKIFWNYYGYIGLMIFSWGTLTLFLHAELLTGEKTALCLATLMGTFWGIRVLVDALYFKHRDWPRGVAMVIGHTLLTTLFCSLTVVYFGLVIWHCIA